MDRRIQESKSKDESGMALLETTLVMPLLLLVLFGICELGLAFARTQVLTNAAREGAREASLFRPSCESGEVTARATKAVHENGARFGMTEDAIKIHFKNVCEPDERVEVSVEYSHEMRVLSGLSRLVGGTGIGMTLPLRARAQMLNEMRG
jgi:hypothetical protein